MTFTNSLAEIPIGGEGGWDILTIDNSARPPLSRARHQGCCCRSWQRMRWLAKSRTHPDVHAFVAVPELQRGFSSNGKESKSSVVDLKTLKTISKIDTGANPDAIVYEPRHREVYVFNHTGNSVHRYRRQNRDRDQQRFSSVAVQNLRRSIKLPVAFTATSKTRAKLRSLTHRNMKSLRAGRLRRAKNRAASLWTRAHHRLFAGCHNKMMVMLDTESGKVVGSVPIGSGVDGCAFDDATQLVFASCGDGTTTIAREQAPNKLAVVQVLKTERGARTMALDPETHRIYLPTAQFAPPPSPSPARPQHDPALCPTHSSCSFTVQLNP